MGRKITQQHSWHTERRSEKRSHLSVLVEFEIHDTIEKHSKKYKSASVNISGSGILINAVHLPAKSLARLIQQQSSLFLEIFLSAYSHPIKAEGKVVWITKDRKEEGEYGLGIKFISINKEDKTALVRYLT